MLPRSRSLRHACGALALATLLLSAPASAGGPMPHAAQQEILDLISSYSYSFDGKDLEALLDLFAEDARWAWYGPDGSLLVDVGTPEELRAFFANTIQSHVDAGRQTRHFQTNTVFTSFQGRRATARTMVLIVWQNAGEPLPVAMRSGTYDDTFVRTRDGWRFEERVITTDQ